AQGALAVEIRLPERFRLLTDQQFDLRVEAAGLSRPDASLQIILDGKDITSSLPVPEVTIEGMTGEQPIDKAWTYRKISLPNAGVKTLDAVVSDGTRRVTAQARIGVQDFQLQGQKSIILFLGDAMGTGYRDAGRIVAKSTHGRFRQGFFDEWQEMDSMPVTGMVMAYALDRIVPDSANTATAWCTGNKTVDGALGVFPDNNDYRFDPM